MLYLIPLYGLCNRMRAIDSAIALAERVNMPLQIIWEKDLGLNCRFDELFHPIEHELVRVQEHDKRPLRFMSGDPRIRPSALAFQLLSIYEGFHYKRVIRSKKLETFYDDESYLSWSPKDDVLIETDQRLISNDNMYSLFKPSAPLQRKIDEEVGGFNERTVGVHIRRTDNPFSIYGSPTDLFVSKMQNELMSDENTRFYVASDCHSTKEVLMAIFGEDRIITSFNVVNRDTKEGMEDGLIQLYALSRTCKILGSHGSSYSDTAADISGIPIDTVVY